MFLFLFFSMLLLSSFLRLKELLQVKNGVSTSLLFFFKKAKNLGRSYDGKRRKKKRMALLLLFRTIIIIAGESHIHGHKENRLELFKFRRHFGEINQRKTLNQPQ